jgi:hypothetical protein
MSKLEIYNGREWEEIAKNGKDAIVDYEYILSQIPKPKDGADGFIDVATIAYLEDKIDTVHKLAKTTAKTNGKHSDGIGLVVRQLRAGTNVTIDNSNMEYPVISATSGSGASAWGDIIGTLSAQTDLNTALGTKAASDHTHTGVYEPADATILKDADIGVSVAAQGHTHEGTAILSTGEAGGTKFLRENGDGTSSWQTVTGGSGITRSVVVTTGNTVLGATADTDYVCVVAGAHTITMPTAVGNTNQYTVKNSHSADITINTTSSQTIDGTTTIQIAPEDGVDIVSNGSNWVII